MLRHLAAAMLLVSCGPSLALDPAHPASPRAPEASPPTLATALTEDPAPPPDEVGPAARAFATDGDEGVVPPIFGIAVHEEGALLPSRETGPADEHEEHADDASHSR